MECPKCAGTTVHPEGLTGETVCTRCGLVIEENQTARYHTGWYPTWPSNWTEEDSETLREWLTVLRTVSCQLNIPSFPYREEAARTIRKERRIFFKSPIFGKKKRATTAALLHLILKEYGKERSINEISQQLSLDSKLVMKQAWTLKENMVAKKPLLKIQRKSAKDYLYEYGGKIIPSNHILNAAEQSLTRIQRKGGNPISLAAGAFYLACKANQIRISKQAVGKAFHVSDRTVDTNERKMRRLIAYPARN